MPTILDEFVIRLGLDSRGFQRDVSSTQQSVQQAGTSAVRQSNQIEESLKKTQTETSKRFKQVEEVGKSATQGFMKLRAEVGGLLATITGAYGMEQFIKSIVSTDRALGIMSKATGIAVKDLAAFEGAAERLGYEGGAEGIKSLADAMQSFAWRKDSGMLATLKTLSAMKGEVFQLTDAYGKAADPIKFFLALADRLSTMTLPQALNVTRELHLPDTIGALAHEGRPGIEKLFAQQNRLGLPTEADAKVAQDLTNSFLNLKQPIIDIGRSLVADLGPGLIQAAEGASKWVIANKDWIEQEIKVKIWEAWQVIKGIGGEISKVVEFMGGWKTATELVFGLWVATKVAPLITAITGVATAMASLATATGAVDVASGGPGIRWLLGAGVLAALALTQLRGDTPTEGPAADEIREARDAQARGPEAYKAYMDAHPNLMQRLWQKMTGGGGASDERKASVRDRLSGELGISGAAAAGVVSNLNAESGLRGINEINPAIPGSRGGFGWAQWTGSRRDAFDAYMARHPGLDPSSDDANVGFLKEELNTSKRGILEKLRRPGITPGEAANEFFPYESGNDPGLERLRGGHVGDAEGIAKLAPTMPRVGPTFGPQLPPQSAIDPAWRYASRSPAALVNNSRSINSSNETNINGNILIQTAAENAEDVSKDLARSLKRFMTPHQADYGLA